MTTLVAALCGAAVASPITYQGTLEDGGVAADGMYDIRFSLSDSAVLGILLEFIDVTDVVVEDGLFEVELDFDDAHFVGADRWLSIRVDGTTLNPRTRLNYVPYAIRATSAQRAGLAADLEVPWVVFNDLDVVDATSSRGVAIRGSMSNTFLSNPGVLGETESSGTGAAGVLGTANSRSDNSPAAGVRGETNATGSSGYGVYGIHRGNGTAVYGHNFGSGTGVSGQSLGTGVLGSTPDGTGVHGISTNGLGILARSFTGMGLQSLTNSGAAAMEGMHVDSGTQFFGASEDYGVEAYNLSSNGDGVAIFGSGREYGVRGYAQEDGVGARVGVLGSAGSSSYTGQFVTGVRGYAVTPTFTDRTATGVYGSASATSNSDTAYGVYGTAFGDGDRYAGYFFGDVHVTGTLSKSSGSFKIDHPMDPENMYLSHSFIESPDMMNIYNGVVVLDGQGSASVDLPDYFESLNRSFRYQLTPVGASMPDLYVSSEVSANQFAIAGGVAGAKVSWQVTGVRFDPAAASNPIVVEEEKDARHRGKYLNPGAYGFGDEKAIHPLPSIGEN